MTEPIKRFTPKGIETSSSGGGESASSEVEVDVIILSTGFDPVGSFGMAFDIGGDVAFDLQRDLYDKLPQAYLGTCLVILYAL